MKYGYIRTSTLHQNLEEQKRQVMAEGVSPENIYADQFTGTTLERENLQKLLQKLKPGDEFICTRFDRIARTAVQGIQLIDELIDRGIVVHVIQIGKLDNSNSGVLIRNIFLAFAEFEKDLIRERLQEGLEYAKRTNPDFKVGRKGFPKERKQLVIDLKIAGQSSKEISDQTGISVTTINRWYREAAQKGDDTND